MAFDRSSFRAGILHDAAGVIPATLRSWPLELGISRGDGHPRYRELDVHCAAIMKQLTAGQGVSASFAAAAINEVRPRLAEIVDRLTAECATENGWRWEGGPYLILNAGRADLNGQFVGSMRRVDIVEEGDIAAFLSSDDTALSMVIVPLPGIIGKSRAQLDKIAWQMQARAKQRHENVGD